MGQDKAWENAMIRTKRSTIRVRLPGATAFLAFALTLAASLAAQVPGGRTVFSAPPPPPADSGWPRVVPSGEDTFTVYQPQLESWEGNQLQGRFAISVLAPGGRDSAFGVATFSARTSVDKPNRTVYLENITFTSVKFPTQPDRAALYRSEMQTHLPMRSRAIMLDRLEADLQTLGGTRKTAAYALANDAPAIVFSPVPALLVSIDGEPVWRPVKGTDLSRVINTSPVLVKSTQTKAIYLHVFDGWLTATSVAGPWTVARGGVVPVETVNDLNLVLRTLVDSGDADPLSGAPSDPYTRTPAPSLLTAPVPKPLFATKPTELIVTTGAPEWATIPGVPLKFVKNTSGRILQDTTDRKIYILLAGRWFTASSLDGPWQYVKGSSLPPSFAQIPDTSSMENVRAAVPGTPQAEEARIENTIPQTYTISRKTAKMSAFTTDGAPKILPVELTGMQYVANASRPVIEVTDGDWYACENGVWFTGASISGPWVVATKVPDVIYTIPPSSPLHYVTYVRVYDSDADSVWVGYTPGYTGVVVNDENVVVYGTGYPYQPWIGNEWYAPPFTYGFGANVGWTPWYGWRYGAGYGYAWGWGGYGLGSYRGVGRFGVGDWGAMTGSVYDRWHPVASARLYGGVDPVMGNPWADRFSMSFNSRTGWAAAGQYGATENVFSGVYADGGYYAGIYGAYGAYGTYPGYYPGAAAAAYCADTRGPCRANLRQLDRQFDRNNVYGDRDGTVFRRNDVGSWNAYGNRGWSSGGIDAGRAAAFNRMDGARSMGNVRAGGYNNAGGPAVRSGGGARRGGGGRRR
jgi:hypothetical protein